MPMIDWDGGGIEYVNLRHSRPRAAGHEVAEVNVADIVPGVHVQYETVHERLVDISVIGKLAAYPLVRARQYMSGGRTKVLDGQLLGCDDDQPFVLTPNHAPILLSGRGETHEVHLPLIAAHLSVQGMQIS